MQTTNTMVVIQTNDAMIAVTFGMAVSTMTVFPMKMDVPMNSILCTGMVAAIMEDVTTVMMNIATDTVQDTSMNGMPNDLTMRIQTTAISESDQNRETIWI